MSSRKLEDLHDDIRPKAEQLIRLCQDNHFSLLIYCTHRPESEQNELYARGRMVNGKTVEGPIVTWARGGESPHNFTINGVPAALAFDCVPLVGGKPEWRASSPLWRIVGALGKSLGLEWAGDWSSRKKEFPHLQLPNWKSYGKPT